MRILLDTNAFLNIYELMENKKYTIPLSTINQEFLIELFNENNCYITSTTLFELLLQCIEKDDKNWYAQFNDYFSFMRSRFKNRTSCIFNDKHHMYFDFELFRTFGDEGIRGFFNKKIEIENYYLVLFCRMISMSISNVCFEKFGDVVEENVYYLFHEQIFNKLDEDINETLKKRYLTGEIDNNEFDIRLNEILYSAVTENIKFITTNIAVPINEQDANFYFEPNNENYLKYGKSSKSTLNDGMNYMRKIVNKLTNDNGNCVKTTCKKAIENLLIDEKFKDMAKIESDYFKHILYKSIDKASRLRKNDVSDYLIASASHYINETFNDDETFVVLTFDKVMHDFLKDYNHMYDIELYSKLNIF